MKMPEGPEVKITGNKLQEILSNKSLECINILGGRYSKKPILGFDDFNNDSQSSIVTIESVNVKGKLIYWVFSNDWIMLNTLGMSGCWTRTKVKHCDVEFVFDKDKKIFFKDMRHFGTLKFIKKCDLAKKLKSLGPDVLTDSFTIDIWMILCNKHANWTLPKLLMNQRKLSGVGNYLKSEILYVSRVSPLVYIKDLSIDKKICVYENIKKIAMASLRAQGVSIRDYSAPDGVDGDYQFSFQVYSLNFDKNNYKVERITTDDKRTTHWVPQIQCEL